jgi:hypothetical protein
MNLHLNTHQENCQLMTFLHALKYSNFFTDNVNSSLPVLTVIVDSTSELTSDSTSEFFVRLEDCF